MAGGMSCCCVENVIYVVGNYNAHSVRKLGESCIGEYCITIGTIPELKSAVDVALNLDSILVADLCGVRYGEILSVCKNFKLRVSEYCITYCAVPIRFTAVLVAAGLNLCNVLNV